MNLPLGITILVLCLRLACTQTNFKTCSKNVFCERYRRYVSYLSEKYRGGLDEKLSIWHVDRDSVLFFENCNDSKFKDDCSTISFKLYNTHCKEIPPLKCSIFVYNTGIFRIKIDETEPVFGFKRYKVGKDIMYGNDRELGEHLINNYGGDVLVVEKLRDKTTVSNCGGEAHKCYINPNRNIASKCALCCNSDSTTKLVKSHDKVTLVIPRLHDFGTLFSSKDNCEFEIVINYNPFNIRSNYCKSELISINGNNFFNFERSGRIYNITSSSSKISHKTSMKDLYNCPRKAGRKNSKFVNYYKRIVTRFKNLIYSCTRRSFNYFRYTKKYKDIEISDIIDAVDVYPKKLWFESYNEFVDFKRFGPTSVGLDIQISNSKDVYGFSEKACSLNLYDFKEPYRFYNVDSFKYKLNVTDPMYGSVPLLISLSDAENRGNDSVNGESRVTYSSVLWSNPSDTYVKLFRKKKNDLNYIDSWWVSETGIIDLSVIISNNIEKLYYLLHTITGFPLFVPRFSLGFHYSKWEETNETRVLEIQNVLTENKIPFDSIWLDIEYSRNKTYLLVDNQKFPNINEIINGLREKDRYLVLISDPHFKVDYKYHVYSFFEKSKYCHSKYSVYRLDYGKLNNYYFKNSILSIKYINLNNCNKYKMVNNIHITRMSTVPIKSPWIQVPSIVPNRNKNNVNDFIGSCWPGKSKFLDIFSPTVQNFYSNYYSKSFSNHTNIGYWIDMNEPAVFNSPELTLPKQVRYTYNEQEERDIHSLYSLYAVKSLFNGLFNKFRVKRRPFILSRSFWVGSNRYSYIWTGDSESNWDYYFSTININVRNAICGFSLTGSDVGGYEGNPEGKLYIRWHQLGIWFPFYREHSSINSLSRFFLFNNEYIDNNNHTLSGIISKYVHLRYLLIPYWYTLSAYYAFYGLPMIKPLFWLNPNNKELRSIDNSFLVGDSFMINSLYRNGFTTIKHYSFLTNFKYKVQYFGDVNDNLYNIWYNLHSLNMFIENNNQLFNNEVLETTPDLVRAGSIIPISYINNHNSYSSNVQLNSPMGIYVYLTGKVSNVFLFRHFVLNNNTGNYYNVTDCKYSDNEEACNKCFGFYNDYIIDPATLHSEGSIYLDDGITYSYLNKNGYIFDDIVFKVDYKQNRDSYYCDNIDSLFKHGLILRSLDLEFQSKLLSYFKNSFEYSIFIKSSDKNLNNSHITVKDINDFQVLNINKNIEYIHVIGFSIKPRNIYALIGEQINTLRFELENIHFDYKKGLNGVMYSVKIYIDHKLIKFGNYDWVIKILA